MTEILDAVLAAVLALAGSPLVLLVVLVLSAVDGLLPPVPSESVVVALAAVSVSTGAPSLWLLVPAAAAGAWVGDNLAYAVGRRWGPRWLRGPRRTVLREHAARGLERRGAALIFAARYIPVGRVVVNLTAGSSGYPRGRFAVVSGAAALTWAVYSTVIGAAAGHWFADRPLLGVVVGVVGALAIGALVDLLLGRRIRRLGESGPPPEPAGVAGATSDVG